MPAPKFIKNFDLLFKVLFSCLLLIVLPAFGQVQHTMVSGRVIDANSGEPVPLAHIYLQNAEKGVVTNLSGDYSLEIFRLPDTLRVSCIGYTTLKLSIEAHPAGEINIILLPKIIDLSEVVISSWKIEPVFKDNQYSVLDYELDGRNIYLLIFRNQLARSELLYLDFAGDTISRKTDLPGKPKGLYKDCLDVIHFLTADHAYQVVHEGEKLLLKYPNSLDKFRETFGDCITSLQDNIFFRKFFYYNLVIEYFGVDKYNSEKTTLAIIRDDFQMNMLDKNPQDKLLLLASGKPEVMGDLKGGLASREMISALRSTSAQSHFLKSILYKPVRAPLKRIDENLVIFDFSNSRLRFYDPSGILFHEVPISFHHRNTDLNIFEGIFNSKGWKDYEVFVDEALYKAYALFASGGSYQLKEIDLFTGNLVQTHKLIYPYPEKIRIRNGYVYFLYKPASEWTKKRLYRQQID